MVEFIVTVSLYTYKVIKMVWSAVAHGNAVYLAHLSRRTTKPAKRHVRSAKTQISLGIRPVWSESSLALNG